MFDITELARAPQQICVGADGEPVFATWPPPAALSTPMVAVRYPVQLNLRFRESEPEDLRSASSQGPPPQGPPPQGPPPQGPPPQGPPPQGPPQGPPWHWSPWRESPGQERRPNPPGVNVHTAMGVFVEGLAERRAVLEPVYNEDDAAAEMFEGGPRAGPVGAVTNTCGTLFFLRGGATRSTASAGRTYGRWRDGAFMDGEQPTPELAGLVRERVLAGTRGALREMLAGADPAEFGRWTLSVVVD